MKQPETDKFTEIRKLYEAGILTEEEYHEQEKNLVGSSEDGTAMPKGFSNKFLLAVIFSLCFIVLSCIGALKGTFAARFLGYGPISQTSVFQFILNELLAMLALAIPACTLDYPKKKKVCFVGVATVTCFFLIAIVSYFIELTISNWIFIAFWLLSPLSIAYIQKKLPQNIERNTQEGNGWVLCLVFIFSGFFSSVGVGLAGIGIISFFSYIFLYKTGIVTKWILCILILVPSLLLTIGYYTHDDTSSPIDAVKLYASTGDHIFVAFDRDETCDPIKEEGLLKSNDLSISDEVKYVQMKDNVQFAYVKAKYKGKDVAFVVRCENGKSKVFSTVGLCTYDFTEFKKKHGFVLEYKVDLSPQAEATVAVESAEIVRSYVKAHNLQTSVISVKLFDKCLHPNQDDCTFEVKCSGGIVFSVAYNASNEKYIIKEIKGI